MTQLPMFGQPPSEPEPKPAGDQAVRLNVLIMVKAAPNPSDRYGETVCIAGIRTDLDHPGWVRLYPINFRELADDASFHKYDIVSVEAAPARQDPRRESWRPRMPTLHVWNRLPNWHRRRPWVDPYIETDTTMCDLRRQAVSNASAQSLALIRPRQVTAFQIAPHPGWTADQQAKIDRYVSQLDLFGGEDRSPLEAPRYSGRYHYLCESTDCTGHKQGLLDWEFVALQRRLGHLDDTRARAQLEDKFLVQMCSGKRDVAFYVGNQAKHPHVFGVLGVYWPPR
ncbi:MAG: hypothetical protein GEV00_21805 [Actinophytocola sp.]|nr:hypothetical protein [Actinophytocola sp.]